MKQVLVKAGFGLALAGIVFASVSCGDSQADTFQASPPMVRVAELEIDPEQLEAYKAALVDEVETSVRLEPGVLALNAVSINGNPAHIRLLEIYADREAYEAHVKSAHFVRYKVGTETMVRSLKLIDTTPVRLCAKASFARSGHASCL